MQFPDKRSSNRIVQSWTPVLGANKQLTLNRVEQQVQPGPNSHSKLQYNGLRSRYVDID